MNIVKTDNDVFIFKCPHCNETIEVYKKQTNCCIFRHAVYKHNMTQIPPHSKKKLCDQLVKDNKVFGCGKPFKFIYKQTGNYVEKCGYI